MTPADREYMNALQAFDLAGKRLWAAMEQAEFEEPERPRGVYPFKETFEAVCLRIGEWLHHDALALTAPGTVDRAAYTGRWEECNAVFRINCKNPGCQREYTLPNIGRGVVPTHCVYCKQRGITVQDVVKDAGPKKRGYEYIRRVPMGD